MFGTNQLAFTSYQFKFFAISSPNTCVLRLHFQTCAEQTGFQYKSAQCLIFNDQLPATERYMKDRQSQQVYVRSTTQRHDNLNTSPPFSASFTNIPAASQVHMVLWFRRHNNTLSVVSTGTT